MAENKLGAAVIGAGEGIRHIKAYHQSPDYDLLCICDPNQAQIDRRMNAYPVENVRIIHDYKEILKMDDVNVVSVASPDYFHAEQSIALLEAGKHVLCEKPMTLDLEEAAAIADTVRKTGNHFMIAHPTRYTPAFILAKKMIARGDIGDLFMAETEYAHNYRHVGGINNWRRDARRDPLLGGGCHAVDFLRWAVDDLPDETFAYGTKKGLDDWPIDYDSYFCLYKFRNGVIGKVMCSIGLSRPYTMRSVFYGTKGTIICDNLSKTMQFSSVPFYDTRQDATDFITIPVDVNSHNAENHADVPEGVRTGLAVKVHNDF